MKKIKIKFVDFWSNFDKFNNFVVKILSSIYEIEYSENPEYLFYSAFGNEHWKYGDKIKIFITGENLCPDFNVCDYGIGFEHMDYGDRYLRYPEYLFDEYLNDYFLMRKKHINVEDSVADRSFCSYVYSNGKASNVRDVFFRELGKYKKIDSGGRWLNNQIDREPVVDKLEFLSKHKFDIAMENSSHIGYTTEKILQAFSAGTIPIYWGNPEVECDFNKNAMINIQDYDDIETAIRRVTELDNDPKAYLKMLQEPAVTENNKSYEKYQQELELFLCNIVEQKTDKHRRNMDYWGKHNYAIRKKEVNNTIIIKKLRMSKIFSGISKILDI